MPNSVPTVQVIRDAIASSGVSIAEWARVNGFSSGLVYQVLEGRRKCVRGQSYRIAVALGIKEGNPVEVARLTEILKAKFQPEEIIRKESKM